MIKLTESLTAGDLPYIARNKKIQIIVRTCVFERVLFVFEYGLYMFCVACMIFANGVARPFAIALLFMCMICAHDVGVKLAIAFLLMSKTRLLILCVDFLR